MAKEIGNKFAEELIVAKVNGEVWDLDRPFEKSSALQFLGQNDEEAQVSWSYWFYFTWKEVHLNVCE